MRNEQNEGVFRRYKERDEKDIERIYIENRNDQLKRRVRHRLRRLARKPLQVLIYLMLSFVTVSYCTHYVWYLRGGPSQRMYCLV